MKTIDIGQDGAVFIDGELALSLEQTARRFHCSRRKLRAGISGLSLVATRVGNTYFIRGSDLFAFFEMVGK